MANKQDVKTSNGYKVSSSEGLQCGTSSWWQIIKLSILHLECRSDKQTLRNLFYDLFLKVYLSNKVWTNLTITIKHNLIYILATFLKKFRITFENSFTLTVLSRAMKDLSRSEERKQN